MFLTNFTKRQGSKGSLFLEHPNVHIIYIVHDCTIHLLQLIENMAKLADLAGYISLFGKNHSCLPYPEHSLVFVNKP